MEAARALDGYHFVDLRFRPGPDRKRLDPAREWALAALPAGPDKTGRLSFVVDSGTIRARAGWRPARFGLPSDLADWTEVTGLEELRRLQATMPD